MADAEGIDAAAAKGGYLCLATSPLQARRLARRWPLGRAAGRGRGATCAGCPAPRPARGSLADGVSRRHLHAALRRASTRRGWSAGWPTAVERLGVVVHEGTPVTDLAPHRVRSPAGEVRARVVVRALEGYTPSLRGHRRAVAPRPLARPGHRAAARRGLGRDRLARARDAGRRAPARRLRPAHQGRSHRLRRPRCAVPLRVAHLPGGGARPRVHDALRRSLVELFPALADVRVSHRWGGVLGVPRDWWPSVAYDPGRGSRTPAATAGTASPLANLAGRTLADLVTGRDTDLVRLPWVGHRSPRVRAGAAALGRRQRRHPARRADRRVRAADRPSGAAPRPGDDPAHRAVTPRAGTRPPSARRAGSAPSRRTRPGRRSAAARAGSTGSPRSSARQ